MRVRLFVRRGIGLSFVSTCLSLLAVKLFLTFSVDRTAGRQGLKATQRIRVGNITSQDIAARFERRRQRLKEACGRLNVSRYFKGLRHADQRFIFPTNSSPTVLYCPIPKTGTTFLKNTFGEANKISSVIWNDRFFVRPVEDYDKAIMFFFTREPYSRILSAYVDKLWSPNLHFWRVFGRDLVRRIRGLSAAHFSSSDDADPGNVDPGNADADPGNASAGHSLGEQCGHDVTFPEFIRYFIQGVTRDERVNTHLVPTYKFCEACNYDYDYIGHLETFREDAAFILSAINVTSFQTVNNEDDIIMSHIIQAFYTDYFDKLKCDKKHRLLLRAWRALQIRGMISMSIAFPFSETMTRFLTKDIFTKIVYGAARKSEKLMKTLEGQSLFEMESRASDYSQSDFLMTARAIQKRMALASAYSLIPMADKLKMKELLKEELELFGYDPQPADVFSPGFPLNRKIFDFSDI